MIKINRREISPLCECGCCQRVIKKTYYPFGWNRFILGHNGKGKKRVFTEEWINNISKSILNKYKTDKEYYDKVVIGNQKPRKKSNYRPSGDTRKKMSEAKIGNEPWNKGKKGLQVAWNKNIPMSEETKLKCINTKKKTGNSKKASKKIWENPEMRKKHSKILKEVYKDPEKRKAISKRTKEMWENEEYYENHSGENHCNWQGGKSREPYPIEFGRKTLKRKIKERDNYQCQNPYCESDSKILAIHHIDYDKKNCNEDNLITLHDVCNIKANFNREFWKEIYQEIIRRKYDK
jgi:hypothetical protein